MTSTTADDEYDLLVIGGGSGGVRAARISAGYGAKVGLIEPQLEHGPPRYSAIGGTCVNVGCVPKKLMVFASHYPEEIGTAAGYGWEGATAGTFNWDKFMKRKNEEITRLNKIYSDVILKKVEIIEGFATLNGKNAVDVKMSATGETKTLKAKNILICVGGWPFLPTTPGIEHAITSNEIFYLKEQPTPHCRGRWIHCLGICQYYGRFGHKSDRHVPPRLIFAWV